MHKDIEFALKNSDVVTAACWIFLFRNAKGKVSMTRHHDFGRRVRQDYALGFTTQFVRDNLIGVQTFGNGHFH